MNILIDLRWMAIGRAGGMEQMAFELVAAIAGINRTDRFWLFCPGATFEEWRFESGSNIALLDSDRFQLVPEGRADFEGDEPSEAKRLGVADRDGLPDGENRILEVDLVHAIGGYIAEDLRGYSCVLTVHDLQHLHFPEHFPESELAARNTRNAASLNAAKAVICVSESARRDVLERYEIDPNTVATIWNIPSGASSDPLPKAFVSKTLSRLGIDSDFVFFPSHAWPHKNHERLLVAFSKVRNLHPNLKLVLTGGEFDEGGPLSKKLRESDLGTGVRHLGFRTPLEVRCLYQAARALVYPSLFEGFGMPVAEAILAGTPVACSDISPLRELGGDAVATFDPKDSNDIAETLLRLLGDSEFKAFLLRSGKRRREAFSPEAIARETCDLYRSVLGLEAGEYCSPAKGSDFEREKARHWGRLYKERRLEDRWGAGVAAWLKTFWISPVAAVRLLRSVSREQTQSRKDFVGRHTDGWIGPVYRDWLLPPGGANKVEIELGAPPEPYDENLTFRISVGEIELRDNRFEKGASLKLKIDLPPARADLIPIRIECDRSFVPKEQGLSEDERALALKVLGVKWKA